MAAGCGGSGGYGFGSVDTIDGAADARAAQDDAPFESGGGGSFFGGDAALPPTAMPDCVPGTYSGQFTCNVAALLVIQFPWNGSISLTLQGQETGGGEFPVLTIAPGAKIMGTDSNGGTFTADLSGQLDCATRKLTGSMQNGLYKNSMLMLSFSGALSAGYDAQATPRAFTSGAMGPLQSPQLPTVAGTCTWSATLR